MESGSAFSGPFKQAVGILEFRSVLVDCVFLRFAGGRDLVGYYVGRLGGVGLAESADVLVSHQELQARFVRNVLLAWVVVCFFFFALALVSDAEAADTYHVYWAVGSPSGLSNPCSGSGVGTITQSSGTWASNLQQTMQNFQGCQNRTASFSDVCEGFFVN